MLLKKLFSKKAQISLEIGILVAASVTVATIASYFYINNYLNSHPENAGKSANKTINALSNVSKKYANSISKLI